jgi:O-antigen/teichoic acid export membrane protein
MLKFFNLKTFSTYQFYLVILRLIAAFLQTVLFLNYAKLASVFHVGLIGTSIGVLGFIVTISDFGSRTLAPIEFRKKNWKTVLKILDLNWFSSFLVLILSLGMIMVIEKSHIIRIFLILIAAWLVFEKSVESILALAISDGNLKEVTYSLLLRKLFPLFLFKFMNNFNSHISFNFSFCLAFGSLLGLIRLVFWLKRHNLLRTPKVNEIKSTLKITKSITSSTLKNQFLILDVILINFFAGMYQVGLYTACSRLINPFILINDAFLSGFRPMISSASFEKQMESLLKLRLIFFSVTFMSLIAAPNSGLILNLFYGIKYHEADIYLCILLLTFPSLLFCATLQSFLIAINDLEYLSKNSSIFALFSIFLSIGLGVKFGGVGVVIGIQMPYVLRNLFLFNHLESRIRERIKSF